MRTVTNGWSVSKTTGSDIEGAILNVAKHYPAGTFRGGEIRTLGNRAGAAFVDGSGYRYGEGNGRRFPSIEAANAWCLERGYLKPYTPRTRRSNR
jgi:hypothetical protein